MAKKLLVFSEQWTDHPRVQNLNTTGRVGGCLDGGKQQKQLNQLLRLNPWRCVLKVSPRRMDR